MQLILGKEWHTSLQVTAHDEYLDFYTIPLKYKKANSNVIITTIELQQSDFKI